MAKYLAQFSYTKEGVQGVLKEGGTKRREATEALVKAMGGKLEAYYFSFGDFDGIAVFDGPDNMSAAAVSMIVNASGAVSVKTTVLLTPEEVDKAVKISVPYRPPGK
jgi:uncharacterized protein with GYD domain